MAGSGEKQESMSASRSTSTSVSKKDDDDANSTPSLSNLLSALALGARSVNSLPLSGSSDGKGSSAVCEEEDDFAYHMAFPEFKSVCEESRSRLAALLRRALSDSCGELVDAIGAGGRGGMMEEEEDGMLEFEDPLLWQSATEACDVLLERVDVYIQERREGREGLDVEEKGGVEVVERVGKLVKERGRRAMDKMMGRLVEMEKPQIRYKLEPQIQNSRTAPFVPPHYLPSQHPSRAPLTLLPGHGLDTRHYDGVKFRRTALPPDAVAPDHHYAHPYADVVQNLAYADHQLEVPDFWRGPEAGGGGTAELRRWHRRHGRAGTLRNPELGAGEEGVWIGTEEALALLAARILDAHSAGEDGAALTEIAVDLEAHSYRSFSGLVCLMQLSIRRPPVANNALPSPDADTDTAPAVATAHDFLIDTLAIPRAALHSHLHPIFANPRIVKVMHGADSDVPWLQRDFGLYVVNLFDTGRAARRLRHRYGGYGLAALLKRIAGVHVDKGHQLSDWRVRPLPHDLRRYALGDTLYLLDLYDRLRADLVTFAADAVGDDAATAAPPPTSTSHANPIAAVLQDSAKVCQIRYAVEPFRPDGYRRLILSRRNRRRRDKDDASTMMTPDSERLLKALYDWRDRVARDEDESITYVCPDSGLRRIAVTFPKGLTALQGVLNPMPLLVMKYADHILRMVNRAQLPVDHNHNDQDNTQRHDKQILTATTEPLVATPSPDKTTTPRPQSPVLTTEALYKQAGWIHGNDSSDGGDIVTEEDNDNDIDVNAANRNFVANNYTIHTLEMGSFDQDDPHKQDQGRVQRKDAEKKTKKANRRGKTVNGLGAAKAIMDDTTSFPQQSTGQHNGASGQTIELEAEDARKRVAKIRQDMLAENLLGIISLVQDREENQSHDHDECVANEEEIHNDDNADEMPMVNEIPRSMQDIYRISHRNRRKAKKEPTATTPTSSELHDLKKAEALLAKSGPNGTGYFDQLSTSTTSNKRQRTNEEDNDDDEPTSDRNADIDMVLQLGWAKSRADVETLCRQSSPIPKDAAAPVEGGKVLTEKRAKDDSSRRHVVEPVLPVGYTAGGSGTGVYDRHAPVPENPFFTGAAVGGGMLNRRIARGGNDVSGNGRQVSGPKNNGKKGGRRGEGGRGGGDKGGKRDGNRSHVYSN